MPSQAVDLTPFGFTPTESLVYGTLLSLGPSTGYALAARCRRARANTYAALEGLVHRGAALKEPGRPFRYRPIGPDALLSRLAAEHAAALDRLDGALKAVSGSQAHVAETVAGRRPLAAVVLRLAGRASASVGALLPAWLVTETLPAWRRAAASLEHRLWILDPPDGWTAPVPVAGVVAGGAEPAAPILLVADGQYALAAVDSAPPLGPSGWWGSHPALVSTAAAALNWAVRSPAEP